MQGSIILLNGASSAGKSTLARALQARLPGPFWHWSIDHLRAAQVLPQARIDRGEFAWRDLREPFFAGFHGSIASLAQAGNSLIVEHIVETQAWMDRLLRTLAGLDVFFVGLHCPLDELERRERARGDRRVGEARADFETTHRFCSYDLECDSMQPAEVNAERVTAAWQVRRAPGAFARMAAAQVGGA
ncbi:chloramphenicol phosphotransferase CPT family protein [Piscinibacterium candidicorallinum]|uniref:Chloramphenicol phosphotransferase CPT family protein n=1 Tax=Piscinibacterium candidicorallinum TaxID=1793872 RepID=A0ABV7H240_9BURK